MVLPFFFTLVRPLQKGHCSFRVIPVLLLSFLLSHTQLIAINYPTLTDRVVDEVGLLTRKTHEKIENLSENLEKKITIQMVVVVLKSLQGITIEEYGINLARYWQIGQKDKNNGVLLILAPSEREIRIEVGYGLEGDLTDALSKSILEKKIIPFLKNNDPNHALLTGAEILAQVFIEPDKIKKEFRNNTSLQFEDFLVFVFIVFFILYYLFNIVMRILNFFSKGKKKKKGSFWDGFGPGGGGSFGGGGLSGRY